jgi:hypothetical protein
MKNQLPRRAQYSGNWEVGELVLPRLDLDFTFPVTAFTRTWDKLNSCGAIATPGLNSYAVTFRDDKLVRGTQ